MKIDRGYLLLTAVMVVVTVGFLIVNGIGESMQSPVWGIGLMFSIATTLFFATKAFEKRDAT